MTLRAGIVGCGKIADAHVEQLRAIGGVELVAVCDAEPLMAEQLGVRYGISRRHSSMQAMIRDESLDVVHIATPPQTHRLLAEEAFQAGCHVFLEKPIALDTAEVRAIVAAADRHDRRLGVNYLYQFESPFLELRRLFESDVLGDVVHIDATYGYDLNGEYGTAVIANPEHWVHRLPGKLFHNVLDHVLCKAAPLWPQGDVTAFCTAFRRRPAVGDDTIDRLPDELRFTLRTGRTTMSGMVSAFSRPVTHTMRVFGTRDSVALDFVGRTIVRVARQEQPSSIGRLMPAWDQSRRYMGAALKNTRQFLRYEYHFFQGMRRLLEHFYGSVRGDSELPIPVRELVWTSSAIDAIVDGIARDDGDRA